MSLSSRSLAWLNLVVILSLLVNLAPPSRPSIAAAAPTAALDSPLPLDPAPKEPLQLQLAVAPEAALPGQVVAYTLTLTNTGATRLRNVAVNAVFAPSLLYLPGDQGEYDPDSYTLRTTLARLKAGKTVTLSFQAQLSDDAMGDLPCSAYVGAGDPTQAPSDTAIVSAGGARESGSGEGLEAGWQLLYNPPVVSTFSGAASYNQPIEVPPGRNGLQPAVNLGYSSRAVDGATWWVDSSFAGLGWSVDNVDITRRNVEYCWDDNLEWICLSDDFSLVLNGASYVLTPGTGVTLAGRYYAENAPGLRIELHEDSTVNYTGQYWTVHTPDGTLYRLGHNLDSEQKVFRVYHATLPQHQVYRWRADQASDVFGNQMAFTYVEYTVLQRDYASYPANIWYNDYGSGQWASQVQFVGSTIGAEPGQAPIFRTRRKLNSIKVYHLGQVVREYALTYQTEDHNHRTLREIDHYGLGGAASGQSLPTTVFDYADFYNKKWELGEHQDHCYLDGRPREGHEEWLTMCEYWGEQFPYPRLVRVENGYGGVTGLTYSDPIYNGSLKYYTVVEAQTWDGVEHVHPNDTAASRTTYAYSGGSCWDATGHGCDAPGTPNSDKLVGYAQTTVRQWEHDGVDWEIFSSSVHQFDTTSYWSMGRETQSEVYEGDVGGTPLQRVANTYVDDSTGLPAGIHFVYQSESTSTVWQNGTPINQRTAFEYSLIKQGGSTQYGNLTHMHEYDENDALYRSKVGKFDPNESAWIVSKPMWSGVYDGAGTLLSLTYHVYDDQNDWRDGPGSQGRLTLTRARVQPDPTPYFEQVEFTVDARFGYDAYGNQTSQTVYEDYGKIEYDNDKWISIRVGGGDEYVTTTGFDTTYNLYPQTVTNPLSQVSEVEYYAVDGATSSGGLPGQVYRAWDANGTATATYYAYDDWGRLTEVARPGDDLTLPTLWYTYADGPAPYRVETWQRETSGCSSCAQPVFNFYDGLGRVLQSRVETKDAFKQAVVNTTYDALGRVSETYVPTEENFGWSFDRPSGWDSRPKTTAAYDALGRVTQVTQTDGATVRSEYDGRRAATLDENGHQRIQETDAFGRLATVKEYVGTYSGVNWSATPYATTGYAYDELDALRTVTDEADNVTTMEYDALGRKLEMDDPDMGVWSYEYDPSGSLSLQTDARLCVTTLDYDALNRLETRSYSGPGACASTAGVSYTYDDAAGGYSVGRRTRMDDGSGYTEWTYDARGRATQEIKVVNGAGTFKTEWDYDAADRPTWIKYPGGSSGQSGEQVDYDYTAQGLLDSVVGSETYVQSTTYDASGRVELRTLGNDTLRADYLYYPWTTLNGRGRLEQLTTGTPLDVDSLQDLRYTYDAVGNVLSIADHKAAGGTQTQTFAYDPLDRLLTAQASGGSSGTYVQEGYTFNEIGNLTDKGGVTQSYPASGPSSVRPHAVVSTSDGRSYQYDANGNQVERDLNGAIYDLSYDAENRLTVVEENGSEVASFVYDGDGQRVLKQSEGNSTVYVGQHFEQESGLIKLALPDAGFEEGEGWSQTANGSWPGSSIWRASEDTASPHSGGYAHVISNHAYGYLESAEISVSASTQYDLYAYARGELDPDDSEGSWFIRAHFYDGGGADLGYQDAASGQAGTLGTAWQQEGGRITTPAGAARMRVRLYNYLNSGWVAYDDVSLKQVGSGTNLAPDPGFEGGSSWSEHGHDDFPATSIWRSGWGTTTPRSGSFAYAISNHAYGYLQSIEIPVSANTQYDLYAYARGELDPDDSKGEWLVYARFYDGSGSYIGQQNAASGQAGTLSTAWQQKGGRITTPASAARMRVRLYNYLNSGWVAYDDVSLNQVGSGTNLAPDPGFEGGSGWSVYRAGAFSNTSVWRGTWGSGAPRSGSYAYVISNQAYGYLTSDWVAVQPNTTYRLSAWMRGEIDAVGSAANWLLRARYYDADQTYLGYTNVELGSAIPASWMEKEGDFVTPADTAYVKVQLWNYMNSGWVAFDDVRLLGPGVAIRKYYYAGGQRVAMRENGTLSWLLGDHLGSTAITANADGSRQAELRYKAWGETRYAWGDTPTQRRFTGQVEDDTIGLYFYNARYYDPALGRFIQADTIVPNPADPQSLNRYAYTRNNPLRYTDPSGHWYYDPGHQALVKTKDPTHENAIDPVSRKHHSGSRYFEYDETWQSSPIQPIMPQDGGAAYCEVASCASVSLPAMPQAKRWGLRLDATASMMLVGIDVNLEITCQFGTLTDCSTTGAIGPEFGSVGVQGAVGPVLAIEDSTKEPRTISTVGGSLTMLGGAEADVSWADGFLEVFAGYSGGGAGGIYVDPASVPFDPQGALTLVMDLASELAGVFK